MRLFSLSIILAGILIPCSGSLFYIKFVRDISPLCGLRAPIAFEATILVVFSACVLVPYARVRETLFSNRIAASSKISIFIGWFEWSIRWSSPWLLSRLFLCAPHRRFRAFSRHTRGRRAFRVYPHTDYCSHRCERIDEYHGWRGSAFGGRERRAKRRCKSFSARESVILTSVREALLARVGAREIPPPSRCPTVCIISLEHVWGLVHSTWGRTPKRVPLVLRVLKWSAETMAWEIKLSHFSARLNSNVNPYL